LRPTPVSADVVLDQNVFFFGHLTPAVADLRYQNTYHPKPLQEKCPALAAVLIAIQEGKFGDGAPFQPCVPAL
jgi:starch phosphorylase